MEARKESIKRGSLVFKIIVEINLTLRRGLELSMKIKQFINSLYYGQNKVRNYLE